ncbi:hypothetical protein [Streptomyces sp. NPDC001820]
MSAGEFAPLLGAVDDADLADAVVTVDALHAAQTSVNGTTGPTF